MFIGDIPRRNAYRYPNETAIETETRSMTWSELNDRVNRLAHGLTELGLRKSDRIAFLLASSAEVVETYFAAAKLGLIVVPLTAGLVEKEVAFLLNDAGAKAILLEEQSVPKFKDTVD